MTKLSKTCFALILFASCVPVQGREKISAEVEVSATKAPVQMTLRLYEKKINVREPLRVQIEIKNIGNRTISVFDEFFFQPQPIPGARASSFGIYLQVVDSKGRPVEVGMATDLEMDLNSEDVGRPAVREKNKNTDAVKLAPGASIKTLPWAYYDSEDPKYIFSSPPGPIGEFSELTDYKFYRSGKFRIRAVYERSMSRAMRDSFKKQHLDAPEDSVSQGDVAFKTPFISFEVLPMTKEARSRKLQELETLVNQADRVGNAEAKRFFLEEIRDLKNEK